VLQRHDGENVSVSTPEPGQAEAFGLLADAHFAIEPGGRTDIVFEILADPRNDFSNIGFHPEFS
jgi:hypothetical protein